MKKDDTRTMNNVLTKYIFLAMVLLMSGTVTAQTNGVRVGGRVFGGGNLAPVNGSTRVTINQSDAEVTGDVYGGGALADVGTMATGETNATTHIVTVTQGTVFGDIYGGGLGQKAVADDPETEEDESQPEFAATVNGKVTVNIGIGTANPETHFANSVSGDATIGARVFGCNNANGTPKDDVTVNIFKTAHTTKDAAEYRAADSAFAIAQVFGGGNQAHYLPAFENKKTTVHVWTCDNTIEYLYGGGNAADVGTDDASGYGSADTVIIDGGRIGWVFGGGNGYSATGNHDDPDAPNYNPGANIFGDASATFRGGYIIYFFGGSNQYGVIYGSKNVSILNDGGCSYDNHIVELYGGNNEAPEAGNIALDMPCSSNPCKIDYLYGGSRNADVGTADSPANITLTLRGGLYDYVFGGNNQGGTIYGNVTLNLFGGTINEAAFGGNNEGGDIKGKITVNMLQQEICPLVVHNIYGGGQLAAYKPTTLGAYPEVNLIHGTVSKKTDGTGGNVFGGGLGSTAVVASSPLVNVGYDNVSMASLIPTLLPENATLQTANVVVQGDVYGGGEEAAVNGSVTVNVQQVSVEGLNASTTVGGDVYGGGALADVNVTTNDSGEPIYNDGTTTSVTLSGGIVGNIYGGGLGRQANQEQSITAVEAKVYGPVQVTVTGGTVTNSVYGCNNLNGAPQSSVNVDIYNTDPATSGSPYALSHVFGGGNQADYAGTPVVNIHNCSNSIGYVYGGGNAADVEGTDVTVYGGNTIGEVYGGCYGADVTTDGTNVKIHGGKIGKVFGGNNASGSVTGDISVNVDKQIEPGEGHTLCDMIVGEVYGGGNEAPSQAGAITIGCTGSLVTGETGHVAHPENIGSTLEGIGVVYGGANKANITNGTITLNINSGIIDTIFGGNNVRGSIAADIQVNINKDESLTAACPDDWYVGDVYGGGNEAWYGGTPEVNIKAGLVSGTVYGGGNNITDGTKGVGGSDVVMTGGTVLGGVYGGCNVKGTVEGTSEVTISGGEIGSQALLDYAAANDYADTIANVFGGGLGANTKVNGNVVVTVNKTGSVAPVIYGDVYGGSALGEVNASSSNTTTVNILEGILKTKEGTTNTGHTIYYGGNVYGGGLGETGNADKGKVNGKVFVNIGTGTPDPTNPFTEEVTGLSGNATIEGNVYGCNNSGGSPQDDVTVNIFQTAHTDGTNGTPNNTVDGDAFAIANVFGGGNEADFNPASDKKTYVNIYTCDNTIRRVFGGGNAAATPEVITHIQGGRFFQVFGGGNGERGVGYGADVNGDVRLNLHGGNIGEYYGGSNQNGTISGTIYTEVLNDSPCGMIVEDFFCGGNFVDIHGDLVTTIACSDGHFTNLYGGCNQATIYGNVILNLCGGTYTNVFGGSKGVAGGISADIVDNPDTTPKEGNITLNLYGGTIENAFGGSNINGNIEGIITVNVIDDEEECPLYITNIYGGSNMTNYTPSNPNGMSPIVNLVHAKYGISGNVYGGSKGVESTEVKVTSNPLVNIGYEATIMNQYLPSDYPTFIQNTLNNKPSAIVAGSVFGGGDAAKVEGNTAIFLRNRAKVFGNVYGGGNMGEVKDNPATTQVEGNTKVIVNGITTQP